MPKLRDLHVLGLAARVDAGERLSDGECARALREAACGAELPTNLLSYIADRLDGEHRNTPGRPSGRDWLHCLNVVTAVELEWAKNRAAGVRAYRARAITAVAARHHLSEERVRALYKLSRSNEMPENYRRFLVSWREEALRFADAFMPSGDTERD